MSFEDNPNRRSQSHPAEDHAKHLQEVMLAMKEELARSQADQEKYFNRKAKDISFEIGEKVWLNRRNIRTKRPSCKLDWKMIGPFKVIERFGRNAYKLDLPSNYHIHNVFHVNLLERDPTNGNPPLDMEVDKEGREYIAEAVRDNRVFKEGEMDKNSPTGLYYLVHWKDLPESENTWKPASQIRHLKKVVRKFHAANPEKPKSIWGAPTRKQKKG